MHNFDRELVALLPNLQRYALSLCHSREIAEELVQVTCQKAISSKSSFQLGTRMDAWLFRILKNSWIDFARKNRTEGIKVEIDDAFDVSGEDGEQTTQTHILLKEAFTQIEKLPEDQREVLLLICVEELSYKEAAEVLGLPIGTIMSRLARARKKVMREMGIKGDEAR